MNFRSTQIEIDLEAIATNYKTLQNLIGSSVKIMAIVKADAYGHGDTLVCRKLEKEGCHFFGVATIEEGIHLREKGINSDIFVLSGCGTEYVQEFVEHRLIPVLSSLEIARYFQEKLSKAYPVHLKIDTGMGRLGMRADQCLKTFQEIAKMDRLKVEGVLSHFGQSEDFSSERTQTQKKIFLDLIPEIKKTFPKVSYFHMANSAAVIHQLGMNLNMVRIGLALYGGYPDLPSQKKVSLKSALKLTTSILSLKKIQKDTYVSYGPHFKTKRESLIATLPLGYADGWKRSLMNSGYVLVRGKRAPIVGAVCMDLTMIDVTDVEGVKVGDEVVCIGSQAEQAITVSDVASWAKTINYEIFCSFTPRIPRVYKP